MQLSIANEFWKRCWSVWVSVVFCGRAFILTYKPVPDRSKSDDRPWHGPAKCLNHSIQYLVHDCFPCMNCSPIVRVAAYLTAQQVWSVNLPVRLRCGRLGYDTALVWLVGGKRATCSSGALLPQLQDCNTVSRLRRSGFVSLPPWKSLVMRLSLYWSAMACRRGGKDIVIHNLRGWGPQVSAALPWEWAVINRGLRGVGFGAAQNIMAKQRITSWAGIRILQCFTSSMWRLTDATAVARYCTTYYVRLSVCSWARVCVS